VLRQPVLLPVRAAAPPLAGEYDSDGLVTPAAYLNHARQWVADGADIVGGCCGVGPQHMRLLSEALNAACS
jgi:S-methylmethionine-dependent homocysteine/selenocysteine methylase